MGLELLLLVVGLALIAVTLLTHRHLRRGAVASLHPARLADYPAISVIRPIRGLDVGAAENLRAALDTGYPGEVETIFVFDDEREPALPLARAAIEAHLAAGHGDSARVLLCGSPPPWRTGKLNAMIAALREARHDLVVFADSDIRPDREALRMLIETLVGGMREREQAEPGRRRSADVGAAFAPVVVASPPLTAGDAGYALLVNGLYAYAAAAAAAEQGGELPFIMGQFMAFRREAISAIGGLEAADGQLVDDMYLGMRLRDFGYRNLVAPHPVPLIQQGLSWSEFRSLFLRWVIFSRTGLQGWSIKLSSWLRGGIFWAGVIAAAVAAASGYPLATAATALAPLLVGGSIVRLHNLLSGTPLPARLYWMPFWLLLAAPLVLFRVYTRREVTWRGRTYQLDRQARLAAPGGGILLPATRAGSARDSSEEIEPV